MTNTTKQYELPSKIPMFLDMIKRQYKDEKPLLCELLSASSVVITEETYTDIYGVEHGHTITFLAPEDFYFKIIHSVGSLQGEVCAIINRLNNVNQEYIGEVSIKMQDEARDVSIEVLKETFDEFDGHYLAEQIRRMELAVNDDPALAIGTAKELLESCCKTILHERGNPIEGNPDIPTLTKATLKELHLLPDQIPDYAKGTKTIKRLLSNLGTIGQCLAELRNLYGTGHGKHGTAKGLSPRHAKLAVGSVSTLATFLYETHKETSAE